MRRISTPPLSALRRLARRAASNRDGAIAIEFALLLPAFIMLIYGAMAIFDASRIAKRVNETAAIVSDLTSRLNVVDDTIVASLFATSEALLFTSIDEDALEVTISSVATRLVDGEEELVVVWSESSDDTPRTEPDGVDLPTIPLGESVILVEVEYDYEPIFDALPQSMLRMTKNAIRRPRFSNEVVFVEEE